jgi:hypothetical protein
MLRKDKAWLGVPYHGVISTDLMVFSVKAVVSKVLPFKRDNGKLIYVIFDLTMS